MKTNKLEKLFDRLRQEGWFCGWGEMCCTNCAWMWDDEELDEETEDAELEYDHISTLSSDQMSSSCFCFDGRKEGVKNLKAILPIIEEMGCTYNWNGKGDQRIEIDWSNDAEQ